jgi:capsular polysaccharide transport system permease protein
MFGRRQQNEGFFVNKVFLDLPEAELTVRPPKKKRSGLASWLLGHKWFALVVILPTALAILYYGLIASDQYVSESRFIIKSPGQRSTQISSLASLIQTTGLSTGQEQTSEVLDYLRSRAALDDLGHRIDLRAAFGRPEVDPLSRYPRPWKSDRRENLYDFYRAMVGANHDSDTQVAVVTVKAFNPADAYRINASLLDLSEDFVNRLNDRAQRKAISEAQRRVTEAENRLRKARVALSAYRNQAQLIDPGKQAGGVLDVANKLVSEQSALQAQLDVMLKVAPANPSIPALRSRIAAVGRTIAAQNSRAVGTPSAISSKLAGFENLTVEQEFATQNYTVASASLEQAREEAQKQQFYLERVSNPSRPDVPELPHRLQQILTIFGATLFLYFTGWMLYVGILEHAPED